MPTAKQVARRGRQQMRRLIRDGARKMIVGRLLTDNSVTVAGAPTGKLWVRSHPASREETAVWTSKMYLPNAQVWVGPSLSGEDEIKGLVYAETAAQLGSKALFAETPPIDGQINVLEVYGQNIVPGRLRAYAESGSMRVYVEAFAHEYGRFEGGYIDLVGHTPMSAGANQWVAVATDPKTNTLYAYDGPEDYNTAANMGIADAFAIVIPNGYYPNGAVVLNAATTEITPANRFIDLRVHAGMRGQLALDDLANVDTVGKADGEGLIWNAGTSQWETGVISGSISVDDGITTVDPTETLRFDPAYFGVTDNGGNEAEVTFIGSGGGMPSQKTTATLYVEEVIADVELSSAGTFDVSSIPAGYDDLRIVMVTRASAAVTGVGVVITFNGDTNSANYQVQGGAANNTYGGSVAAGFGSVTVANTGTANFWTEVHLHLPLYADTSKFKVSHMNGADPRGAPNNHWHLIYSGIWKSTAAINRIQIAANNATNTFVAGSRLRILGIKQQQVVTDVTGGGLDTSTANVSNPPTDAELDSALGTPAAVGAGYQCLLDDGGADANAYLVVSNGTSWWFTALTKAT